MQVQLKDIRTNIVVGKPFKIGHRTFYPVVRMSTLNNEEQSFFGAWISPLAIVVVEPTQEYAIPVTDESITLQHLFEIVPSLKRTIRDNVNSG